VGTRIVAVGGVTMLLISAPKFALSSAAENEPRSAAIDSASNQPRVAMATSTWTEAALSVNVMTSVEGRPAGHEEARVRLNPPDPGQIEYDDGQ